VNFVLTLTEGTKGKNRFGSDPKAGSKTVKHNNNFVSQKKSHQKLPITKSKSETPNDRYRTIRTHRPVHAYPIQHQEIILLTTQN
jgi:hypothetical protein